MSKNNILAALRPRRLRLSVESFAVVCIFSILGFSSFPAAAQDGKITVHVNQPGHAISPNLYGLMTEEINYSYDGGLYAELIRNRSFEDDSNTPVHWSLVEDGGGSGAITLDHEMPLTNALPTSLRLDITNGGQRVGVANDGFWGIPVKPNTKYTASFYAKATNFTGHLTLDIESSDGSKLYADAIVSSISGYWNKYTAVLKTGSVAPTANARFVISSTSPGTIWLNVVSLFPPTYDNAPNGNRPDLMKLLGNMNPAFLRLPGGNYLEGNSIAERFEWKNTIGPLTDRAGHESPWGYRSSDGMGLPEFLEWCEELHMQPVLALYAGYSLDHAYVAPGPELAPYVQDAMDEIEYVTGDNRTKWGMVREAAGHPKPFPLTYVEISIEDGGYDYNGRFAQFFDAIKARYPQLQIIATSPVTSRRADLVDDHYYRSAAAMESDSTHYDHYSRTGPKIFVGEWASTEGSPTPTMNAALGDAAWLTGLERNSDLVKIASYAPLLVNVNPGGSQWGTNLIGYNALSSYGSPSYYAQAMFGKNRGDVVLPVEVTQREQAEAKSAPPHGAVGVGSWATQVEYRNIKVTSGGQTLYSTDFSKGDADWTVGDGAWQVSNGVLSQTGDLTNCRAVVGSPDWTDYTYTLQARKTGGAEGFLVLFHVVNSDNYIWWNIGGWGNTRTQLEVSRGGGKEGLGQPAANTVAVGRWYDIKIEVKGDDIKCYLDGRLVTETSAAAGKLVPLYTEASRDKATGDVILKVVNITAYPQTIQINLDGAVSVNPYGKSIALSGDPLAVNTIDNPKNVAPKTTKITNAAKSFTHTFPAHSVNVLRVNVK